SWVLAADFALLLVGAYGTYVSIDGLVTWISSIQTGFISARHLGWLSGWLMVVPNGLLALYYGWKGQPEIVYTSQVGDGHICIPLCVGLYALQKDMPVPPFFQLGMLLLIGATLVHFLFVALSGKLPRFMGLVLTASYGYFIYQGLLRRPRWCGVPGSQRELERVGTELVAQLDERHLCAQPKRVFGNRAHGLGCVVADQVQSVA